jgi:threonine/homoserine/homoserine lactone efflux protein
MRYAGAVYLIYHGYWAWAAGDEQPSIGESMPSVERAPLQTFCIAFGAGMSNLKALLFVAAFLPQCNDAAAAYGHQFTAMVATFAVIEISWFFVYALAGRRFAVWSEQPAPRWTFNHMTDCAFVLFGFAIAAVRA